MTTYNKSSLAAFFQTGDVPDGTDYANLIDSQINVVETSAQSMAGPLVTTEVITPRVSAATVNITGTLTVGGQFSAANFNAGNISTGTVSAASVFADNVSVSATVSANNLYVAGEFIRPVVTIAASGTTLATANIVSAANTRLITVSDGTATGLKLMANKTGLVQLLYNETATSANLYPCVGGQINVLASGAPFALSGSTLYTILHTKASGYAVK